MALPVLAGPFRCALIYNHEKQPLIELSIRVSLPLVDLLRALSQVAPPIGVKEPKAQRPPAKAPGGDTQRGYPSGSPTPSGNWRGYPLPQTWRHSYGQQAGDSRHSWEPCPTAPITPNTGPHTSTLSTTSDAQVDEQVQLLWALSDPKEDPPKGSAPVKKQQRREVRLTGGRRSTDRQNLGCRERKVIRIGVRDTRTLDPQNDPVRIPKKIVLSNKDGL